jgi:predicted GTPase
VINKVAGARPEDVESIRAHVRAYNPEAQLVESDLEISIDHPAAVAGKRVLVVEDGPTLTHGGMAYGAGTLAARRYGAAELVDPRPLAVGTIAEAYRKYPHLGPVLPALGYSPEQCRELAQTIRAAAPEVIIDASPASLDRLLDLEVPFLRVHYRFCQRSGPPLLHSVDRCLANWRPPPAD